MLFCAVPGKLSGGGPRQSWHHNSRAKTKTHEGDSPTPDITQLFFLDLAQAGWKATRDLHTHAVDSAIQLQGNNRVPEEASTPNIGRGAEPQPKTTMHSLTTTVRTLPSIAGLQA